MNNILIDTNIYTSALKGDHETIIVLQRTREIGICSITIGELLSGFKAGNREKKNREELSEFLDMPRVNVYGVDENTAEFYSAVINNLRNKGKPIPTNDIWIAAVAFQYGFPLFTKDKHFEYVPGLVLVS
ncbi:MAG: type II toxin-antitoxin system VapC family toxin [Desulfatiglans sp.]|nr:type II toxin-antitoxin system VapC family toxin [Desulfatiglans sp.]